MLKKITILFLSIVCTHGIKSADQWQPFLNTLVVKNPLNHEQKIFRSVINGFQHRANIVSFYHRNDRINIENTIKNEYLLLQSMITNQDLITPSLAQYPRLRELLASEVDIKDANN